jgi:hypothetical protein
MKYKNLLIVFFLSVFNISYSQAGISLLDTIGSIQKTKSEVRISCGISIKYLDIVNTEQSNSDTLYFNKLQIPNHLAFNYSINSNDSIACHLKIFNLDRKLIQEQKIILHSTQGNVLQYTLDLDKTDYKGEVFIEIASNMLNRSNDKVENAIFDVEFSKTLSMDIETFNLFDFYPNPSSGTFNVLIQDGIQLKKIEVYEMNGRVLSEIDVNGTFVDLGGVHEGVFILVVTTDVGPFTKKLVVRR